MRYLRVKAVTFEEIIKVSALTYVFIQWQFEAVEEYSEVLARRLIEKITVYDEMLVVEFKLGLTIEVEV